MNMALKAAQARKELMEALAAAKGLAGQIARLEDDIREGRITLEEADTLNKAHAAIIKRLNAALKNRM